MAKKIPLEIPKDALFKMKGIDVDVINKDNTIDSTMNDTTDSTTPNINDNTINNTIIKVVDTDNVITKTTITSVFNITIPEKGKYLDTRKQKSYYIKHENLKQMEKLVKVHGFNRSDIVNQSLELFYRAFEEYLEQEKTKK